MQRHERVLFVLFQMTLYDMTECVGRYVVMVDKLCPSISVGDYI